jgi:glycosyltransferase involved in cell wall biosynthesis
MLARSSAQALGVRPAPHVLFLHLGDCGFGRFTLELARSVAEMRHVRATFCISPRHAIFDPLTGLACDVLPADIGEDAGREPAHGQRAAALYHNVAGELVRQRSTGMVSFLPGIRSPVWRSMLARLAREHEVRNLAVIHDLADIHRSHPHRRAPQHRSDGPLREAEHADPVITFSRSVADTLAATRAVPRDRLVTLFHPDLTFDIGWPARAQGCAGPFRVLVLDYVGAQVGGQGLPELIEAIALLRTQGVPVELGVFGTGPLGVLRARLMRLGAEVETRAITDHELPAILARHHAVALLPGGCGQCAVAAIALGAGLPLIGWRAGWLTEQAQDGATGVIAGAGDPASLAAAIGRLATDAKLYADVRAQIRRSAWERSMRRFAEHLVALAIGAVPLPDGLTRRDLTWV